MGLGLGLVSVGWLLAAATAPAPGATAVPRDGGCDAGCAAPDADGRQASLAEDADGLVARAVVDVPMFLAVSNQPKAAPFIGFLRAGTPIQEHHAVKGSEHILAGVPFLRPGDAGTVRKGFENGHSEEFLFVYLPARIGTPPKAMASPGPASTDALYGLFREISLAPGKPGFAFVHCGKLRVLERRGEHLRVAAELDAGELYGWIEAPSPGARDTICDSYALAARSWTYPFHELPHGYERVNDELTAPHLLALARARATLYRPEKKNGELVCRGWKFAPARNPHHGKLVLDAHDLPAEYKEISSRYGISGSRLSFLYPVHYGKDGSVTAGGCFSTFSAVRVYAKRLLVVKGSLGATGYGTPEVTGFRRSTVHVWYRDRDDCEQALRGEQPPAGGGCCWELQRK